MLGVPSLGFGPTLRKSWNRSQEGERWGTGEGGKKGETTSHSTLCKSSDRIRKGKSVGWSRGGSRQTHGRAQRREGAHHGGDDPADTDGVSATSIWHAPPVQDVQAGIQHPVVKLEGGRAEVTPRPAPAPLPHPTCL